MGIVAVLCILSDVHYSFIIDIKWMYLVFCKLYFYHVNKFVKSSFKENKGV